VTRSQSSTCSLRSSAADFDTRLARLMRAELTMRSLVRARHLLASNYGRDDGWSVELDGRSVGELSDARFEEMFWDSYAVSAAHDSPIFDDASWNACRFDFRNRRTGDVVTTAFVGGAAPFIRHGRVHIRGLHLKDETSAERLWLRMLSLIAFQGRR
jgi:hypothetical protein